MISPYTKGSNQIFLYSLPSLSDGLILFCSRDSSGCRCFVTINLSTIEVWDYSFSSNSEVSWIIFSKSGIYTLHKLNNQSSIQFLTLFRVPIINSKVFVIKIKSKKVNSHKESSEVGKYLHLATMLFLWRFASIFQNLCYLLHYHFTTLSMRMYHRERLFSSISIKRVEHALVFLCNWWTSTELYHPPRSGFFHTLDPLDEGSHISATPAELITCRMICSIYPLKRVEHDMVTDIRIERKGLR